MKKILVFMLFVSMFSCNNKESGYNILGVISDAESAKIELYKLDNGEIILVDTTECINSQFSFSGKIENPDRYYIKLSEQDGYAGFFNENSNIELRFTKDDFINPKVTGSITNALYDSFVTEFKSIYLNRIDSVRSLYKNAENDKQRSEVNSLFDAKNREAIDFIINFSTTNNSSVVAPYVAYRYIKELVGYNNNELSTLLDKLDSQIASAEVYKLYANWTNKLVRIEIGKPAVDFTMNDTLGNPISLLSFNNKYLLLDFWSSKCGPCRREHPNLLKVYNIHKNIGFEILAVSFDNNRDDWIKAIKEDKIIWPQVSSLTGWDNEALEIYCIDYIPQNVLIDENGIIIGKNLNARELGAMLEGFFKL